METLEPKTLIQKLRYIQNMKVGESFPDFLGGPSGMKYGPPLAELCKEAADEIELLRTDLRAEQGKSAQHLLYCQARNSEIEALLDENEELEAKIKILQNLHGLKEITQKGVGHDEI